ncbi:MAG TPA: DNA polymerase III subunit chi [Burkholderiales bacterium]|nr:DNA polymerase III subunit chi [Burkholderiales bacterium]
MTRIDFYSNAEPKLQIACRLVARLVQQQLRVVVFAPDEEISRGFDNLLETYQVPGCGPHRVAHHAAFYETPVVIAREDADMAHYQVILNLHADSPPSFSRFERLVELVGTGDGDRQLARSRFRFYRDRGYEINHYDLSKSSV